MEQIEILMDIKADVAGTRSQLTNLIDDMKETKETLKDRDKRLRRLEMIVLPLVAAVSYVGIAIF